MCKNVIISTRMRQARKCGLEKGRKRSRDNSRGLGADGRRTLNTSVTFLNTSVQNFRWPIFIDHAFS
jgi:hypothetical protein